MLLNVQVEEAKRAYETGGRDGLSAVLAKFQQITQVEVVFTDSQGYRLAHRPGTSGPAAPTHAKPLADALSV